MIVEHYENPNKKKYKYSPPATTKQEFHAGQTTYFVDFWAKKKNITDAEFIRRDNAFRAEARDCFFFINETVYPVNYNDFHKMGKCRISKIYRTYGDEDAKWMGDNIKPHVVEVVAEGDNWALYTASRTFFTRLEPVKPEGWVPPVKEEKKEQA